MGPKKNARELVEELITEGILTDLKVADMCLRLQRSGVI